MQKKRITITVMIILAIIGFISFIAKQDTIQRIKNNEHVLEQNTKEVKQEKGKGTDENLQNAVSEEKESSQEEEFSQAPDFMLENMKGQKIRLSDFRGKNILINFWATRCPYCVMEMPDLNKLYVENKEKDFMVLAISIGESKGDLEKYLKAHSYEFPILLDKDGKIAMQYMVRGIPTSFMIDKDGRIREMKIGIMTYEEMKQMLQNVEKANE